MLWNYLGSVVVSLDTVIVCHAVISTTSTSFQLGLATLATLFIIGIEANSVFNCSAEAVSTDTQVGSSELLVAFTAHSITSIFVSELSFSTANIVHLTAAVGW